MKFFLFFPCTLIAIMGTYVIKKYNSEQVKPVSILLFGIAGIFLIASLITPPDIISNFIIAVPTIIIYSIIIVIKMKNK